MDINCIIPQGTRKTILNNFNGHDQDRAFYLISCIYNKYITTETSLNQPIELPRDFFADKLGKSRHVKNKLEELDIISSNHSYSTKSHTCKSYIFGYQYRSVEHEWHTVNIVHRKKRNHRANRNNMNDNIIERSLDLLKQIEIEGLSECSTEKFVKQNEETYRQDVISRIDYNQRTYRGKGNNIVNIEVDINSFIKERVKMKMMADICSLEYIKQKSFYAERNTTNRRLDTNVTNLRSMYTKQIRLNGEKMIQLDLSCSQYAILSNILLDYSLRLINFTNLRIEEKQQIEVLYNYFKNNKMISDEKPAGKIFINIKDYHTYYYKSKNYLETNDQEINSEQIKNKTEKPQIEGNNRRTIGNKEIYTYYPIMCVLVMSDDFIIKAIEGELYEHIGETLMNGNNRDTNKSLAFQLLFGKEMSVKRISYLINKEPERLITKFIYKFNYIFRIINTFKATMVDIERKKIPADIDVKDVNDEYRKIYKKENNKNLRKGSGFNKVGSSKLSIMLQVVESYIFIDNILARLYNSDIRALSLHDSILVPESEFEQSESIVIDELSKFLPYGYTLKGGLKDEKKTYINNINLDFSLKQAV
jgi:hypothetical protein